MGLETGTYISDLVSTNPVGATDPKSAGDDHLRLIKSTIKATFAAITGAVTATHTELNYSHGVTGVEGTGKFVLAASGVLPALSGANLTSLPAANLSGTLPAISGANLTNLNATNLASGTVADARLSSNIPLKNAANVLTASATGGADGALSISSAVPLFALNETDGATNNKLWSLYANGEQLLFAAFNDAGNASGTFLTVDRTTTTIDIVALAATTLSFTGVVSTPGSSAAEVGTHGVPVKTWASSSDNPVLADRDKTIYATATGTITIDDSLGFPIGTTLTFVSGHASGNTVAITTGAMYLAGTGFAVSGSRTLPYGAVMTAYKYGTLSWLVSGPGVS